MENCKQTDPCQQVEKQIDPQEQRANNDPHRRFEEKKSRNGDTLGPVELID